MNKRFKCISKTETEQGFSVHFSVVIVPITTQTPTTTPKPVEGNLSMNNLTSEEAELFNVGSLFELKPVVN